MIKITIADDHPVFTSGLAAIIEKEEDFEVVDIVHNGTALLQSLKENDAALVILDINMPGINGMDVLQKIRQFYPAIKIIMLSTYAEPHLIEKAEKAGANGYVVKSSDIPELIDTIREVSTGNRRFQKPKNNSDTPIDDFSKQFFLTRREKEILRLIGKNHTNQQIAEMLCLSIYTVETHRKNIMEKLGLKKPAALIQFIHENHLLMDSEANN